MALRRGIFAVHRVRISITQQKGNQKRRQMLLAVTAVRNFIESRLI